MREFWIIMLQSGSLIGIVLLIRILFRKKLSARVKYLLWISKSELIYLREQTEEERMAPEIEKTVITYGCVKIAPYDSERRDQVQKQIIEFNRRNPEYKIELREYDMDTQDALTRISAEIAAGKGPDIIDLDISKLLALAEQGYLEDIGAYLERDEELDREDYHENFLNAFETDGTLYIIPYSVTVDTFAGKALMLGDRKEWTLNEMLEWASGQPEGTFLLAESDRLSFLACCLWCNWDQFIDWENAACSFDGEDFVRLLEVSAQLTGTDYQFAGVDYYDESSEEMFIAMAEYRVESQAGQFINKFLSLFYRIFIVF